MRKLLTILTVTAALTLTGNKNELADKPVVL